MAKYIAHGVFLFALWLLMSGIYDNPLIVGFGVISSVLATWIVYRLDLFPTVDGAPSLNPWALIKYLFWLVVEIGKADWAVTKVIIAPETPKRQRLIKVAARQNTDIGRMMFANSITITPGTISVETYEKEFLVHALTGEAADMGGLEAMGKRVCDLETPTPARASKEAG